MNMKKQLSLPKKSMALSSKDPHVQNMVINYLRESGVPVHYETIKFDPDYPVLVWIDNSITQGGDEFFEDVVSFSVEEFINKFFIGHKKVKIGGYDVEISNGDSIEVGCKKINFNTIAEVYLEMKKFKKS
jgi:hypothetical protein